MGEDYHTRLPNDWAMGIEEYAEDHGVTKAEALRRATRSFLKKEGYIDTERRGFVQWFKDRIIRGAPLRASSEGEP